MTLNLKPEEMEALEKLAEEMDMSKTAVMRHALRLLQLVHIRTMRGEQVFVQDRLQKYKSELILLSLPAPPDGL